MADTKATQNPDNATDDAPVTTRMSFLDSLPGDLASDRYVRYVAEACDQAREDLDRERERTREARDEVSDLRRQHMDTLFRSIEKDQEIARLKARGTWTPAQVADLAQRAFLAVVIVAFFAMVTITTVMA